MTADGLLEETCCPLCTAAAAEDTPFGKGAFRVRRCAVCGLHYLSPRPAAQLARATYASETYFDGGDAGYADYAAQERSLRLGFRILLHRLAPHLPPGADLLEIGAGYGWFLDEARRSGRFGRLAGTEMSAAAAARARALGLDVAVGGVAEVAAAQRFDVAVAFQVIEHVYEPVPFLSTLAARLRPGGALVLTTPDMGSPWRRALGRRWPSFKIPEHVTFWDAGTLGALMRRAGLEDVREIRCTDVFPLSELLRKLGLPAPRAADAVPVRFPGTSTCVLARVPGGGGAAAP